MRVTHLAAWIGPVVIIAVVESLDIKVYYSISNSRPNIGLHSLSSNLVVVPKSILLFILHCINLKHKVNPGGEGLSRFIGRRDGTSNDLLFDLVRGEVSAIELASDVHFARVVSEAVSNDENWSPTAVVGTTVGEHSVYFVKEEGKVVIRVVLPVEGHRNVSRSTAVALTSVALDGCVVFVVDILVDRGFVAIGI